VAYSFGRSQAERLVRFALTDAFDVQMELKVHAQVLHVVDLWTTKNTSPQSLALSTSIEVSPPGSKQILPKE
jgi:hypothetical protein